MRVKSVLSTVAVGLMLVVGLDYVAYGATGQSLVLGKANKANKVTALKRTTPGPALSLKVKPGSAPFAVNSGGKVVGLNADKLDGLDSTALRNADRLDGLDSSALVERVSAFEPPDSACAGLATVTTTYEKIADVGTISTLPTTRYTRIDYSTTFSVTLSGVSTAAFELRVDGAQTTLGRAVHLVRESDDEQYGTLTGIFEGLTPGTHTLSIWSRRTGTGATDARIDTGCSSVAGNVYVTEFR